MTSEYKAKPFSVTGKTAIVTGAGSGINFSFTQSLLSKGCNVVLADLSLRPEAKTLVEQYTSKDGPARAVFVKTDVTSWTALSNMFEVAISEFGSFDIVCPGAGIYEPHWSNFWNPPGSPEAKDAIDGDRYALVDINVTHPIRTTQLALQYWLYPPQGKDGTKIAPASVNNQKRVIMISSVAGHVPVFRAPIYGATKYAITGFTRCLANLEPRNAVRVNAVAPGLVKTPIWMEHPEKLVNIDQEKDGWVTSEEVAQAMLDCVQKESLIGGTILEIGKDHTREVGVFNDPGPNMSPGSGIVTSKLEEGDKMVQGWLGDENVWGLKK